MPRTIDSQGFQAIHAVLRKMQLTIPIIMIIGIGISTWGFLENQSIYVIIGTIVYISSVVYGSKCKKNIDDPIIQREIKEDIIVGLQRLNLRDRTSIEQLENEIKQYQIKQEKASKGLTKGCVAILSTGISIFLGEIFWIFNY